MNNKSNQIDFQTLHVESSSTCSYCNGLNSKSNRDWPTSGFTCKKMSLNTYQLLMDRCFRRCGTYYYKTNYDKCCCRPYTIRLDVNDYKIRHSHKKLLRKFNKFINEDDFNEEKKHESETKIIKEKKTNVKIDNKLDFIANEMDSKIIDFFENFVKKEIIQFTFIKINEISQICKFNIPFKFDQNTKEEIFKNLKFMKSLSKKFNNSYTTNFLPLFYNSLKTFCLYKLEEFIKLISDFYLNFLNSLIQYQYQCIISIQPNGIIIFDFSKEKIKDIKQAPIPFEEEKNSSKENPLKKSEITQNNILKKTNLIMKLEKAKFEQESFELYQKYCKIIHGKEKESKEGYTDFLCQQALEYETLKSSNGKEMYCGCYHMKYYYKEKLFAIGVVDILPSSLSSVYFFYDPDPKYKKLGIGIIGSLKEIEYIQNLQINFNQFKYYYLGFYIQSCQKMRYKADYEPAQLVCPKTYKWIVLDQKIKELIDKNLDDSKLNLIDNDILNDMFFINDKEVENIIRNKIRLCVKDKELKIANLIEPYRKIFQDIFMKLIRIMGKEVINNVTFAG